MQSLEELGTPDIVMLDVAPAAAARLAGDRMPRRIARALTRYRHGPATFKVDFAVEGGIPWTYEPSRRAGTVHVGGGLPEIAAGEKLLHARRMTAAYGPSRVSERTLIPGRASCRWTDAALRGNAAGTRAQGAERCDQNETTNSAGHAECRISIACSTIIEPSCDSDILQDFAARCRS